MGEEKKQICFRDIIMQRKLRLGPHTFPEELKLRCFKSIATNFSFYSKMEEMTGSNPFDQLPATLKTELLSFVSESDTALAWMRLLANKTVTKVTIRVHPQSAGSTQEYLEILAREKVQLLSINILGSEHSWEARREEITKQIIKIFSAHSLSNLQVLSLDGVNCTDEILQLIAFHLKQLRVLKAPIHQATDSGLDSLSVLENLEEFHFNSNLKTREQFNRILQHLPKLRLIVEDEEPDVFDNYCYSYAVNLAAVASKPMIGLEHMIITEGSFGYSPKMPNLTSLSLRGIVIVFRPSAQLANVTSLGLFHLSNRDIQLVLNVIGRQIKVLNIQHRGAEQIMLDQILPLVPHVETLCLDTYRSLKINLPFDASSWLLKLKVLKMQLCHRVWEDLQAHVLPTLMRGPNLRYIQFNFEGPKYLSKPVVLELVRQVKDRAILQKLEQLYMCQELWDQEDKWSKEVKDMYYYLMDNLALHCPCLVIYDYHDFSQQLLI